MVSLMDALAAFVGEKYLFVGMRFPLGRYFIPLQLKKKARDAGT
jgi:hypothetical protein